MPTRTRQSPPDYLTPAEVARMLGVTSRTVLRYEEAGRLTANRLPSGHRRYRREDVERLLNPDAVA